MIDIDRSIPPQSKVEDHLQLPEIQKCVFSNQVPLYSLSAGLKEVIKVEFVFDAGSKFQKKPLLAHAVNELLKSGTNSKSQSEISSEIDKYGAFIEHHVSYDSSNVILYALVKHLPKLLEIVKEILFDSIFPDSELRNYLRHQKQNYLINHQKVEYLARKAFQSQIFGKNHPYGRTVDIEDFNKLEKEDLLEFYKSHYTSENLIIYASGNVSEEQQKLLETFFGNHLPLGTNSIENWNFNANIKTKDIYIEKAGSVQSAIRLGRRTFTKKHEDYIGLQFLATVLGGYFGSRLMKNIREDKGYTYGIGAAAVSFLHEGYFFIATEVGVEVSQSTINEIYKEMQLLCSTKIPEKELELVKNYIYGKMLRSFDGPFNAMDQFISIQKFGFDNEYFHRKISEIAQMKSEHLLDLANKYFQKSEIVGVVVG